MAIESGNRQLDEDECLRLLDLPQHKLVSMAAQRRDEFHGSRVTYSRKVFIPLTQLCRDVCHYCTFAQTPSKLQSAYLTPEQVLDIARAGVAANCNEALFTLGDKPELRYASARTALQKLGYKSTLEYLAAMARLVIEETGLLPHLNPGVMRAEEIQPLRSVSVSMGIMLESTSPRLLKPGGCHHGSPDKAPEVRLATIRTAGELSVPFTSGILIGIGESKKERIESLLALRRLHDQYGHLQDIIIQNFRAKPGTLMADAEEPSLSDLQWTIAVARLIFDEAMNIQAPPNLSSGSTGDLIAAGINDWGGVSPVTPDHVNPEAPWPHLQALASDTARAGKCLTERLGVYPAFIQSNQLAEWIDSSLHKSILDKTDAEGLARTEHWCPGTAGIPLPALSSSAQFIKSPTIDRIVSASINGRDLTERDVNRLFAARDGEVNQICEAADQLRQSKFGDSVSYVVTRNINYTNICYFKCQFCAFSKGKTSENLRGKPYNLALSEIVTRAREAWSRGAVEVCLQGGIHPSYTGQTYIDIVHAIKNAVPDLHIHAFSPLEIYQGATTLGVSVQDFLQRLIDAGLGSLPGTAAEILDDEVRAIICPDKINTQQWFDVINTAHELNLKTTSTIMFGHVDRPVHWTRHLLRLREQQQRFGGFTELVPLPFVHMEAPIYRKGRSRRGPSWRECVLMHAVSRLVLHRHIPNIQTSWVKLGVDGITRCLSAGANDIGGTLMNETITRSAGAMHGQEMTPEKMEEVITSAGRVATQRTTLYREVATERRGQSTVHSKRAKTPLVSVL